MKFGIASGINNSGDFDQLSLAGVDFGEDYCENYGITPTNLGGTTMYGGHLDQLGMDYSQMGVIPEGLSGDYDQMGIVPEGLGHGGGYFSQMGGQYNQMGGRYNQLGVVPSGLMGIPQGLGFMDQFNAMSPTHKMLVGVAVGLGAYVAAKQFGLIKGFGLPVIG